MNGISAPVQNRRLFEDDYHVRVAIPALVREKDYKEIFSDHNEEHKSSFDSLGFLDKVPCFIEVKLHVSAAEVRHVEAKLSEGFRRYGRDADQSVFAEALRKVCPVGITPLFGVIALSYGDEALVQLVEILRRESEKLQFAWVVWCCSAEGHLSEIAADTERIGAIREGVILLKQIVPVRTSRKPLPEKRQHFELASTAGIGILFEQAMSMLEDAGAKLTSKAKYLSGQIHGTHIRLYSDGSSAKEGLLLGIVNSRAGAIIASGLSIVGYGHFGHPEFRIQNNAELTSFLNELAKFKNPDQYQTAS